jgi:hypothetical protein
MQEVSENRIYESEEIIKELKIKMIVLILNY